MIYDLSKKLKDAGFPQKDTPGLFGDIEHEHMVFREGGVLEVGGAREKVYYPTSDELIEELGKDFDSLHRWSGEVPEVSWKAFSDSDWGNTPSGIEARGDTPLEALAELYIAIHKK